MAPNFHNAAKRHCIDAESLFRSNRIANADHLFGLSAECALKEIGVRMKFLNPANTRKHRLHTKALLNQYRAFANGMLDAKYIALLPPSNAFDAWDVAQRYDHENTISPQNASAHRQATERCIRALDQIILDGN